MKKNPKKIAGPAKKKPRGVLAKLKSRLARLQDELATPKSNQARLLSEIRLVEEKIKIERFHRISKLNSVSTREILCGSPGLGKKA
ncbi:hypothetical protein [Cupriavidus sp. L7L]|uniref:hypothetical protein n=1 Tax=Cupriavidus sp. L7L TaxID=2546443 RepID=UPI0010545665|nr:hypothetical protein [Cupriavidus sp. L7L]TDF53358.1 hypothetical protein E1J61_37030 [Cupriavidus sp. L7L]